MLKKALKQGMASINDTSVGLAYHGVPNLDYKRAVRSVADPPPT
jgi:hypothetical protein